MSGSPTPAYFFTSAHFESASRVKASAPGMVGTVFM